MLGWYYKMMDQTVDNWKCGLLTKKWYNCVLFIKRTTQIVTITLGILVVNNFIIITINPAKAIELGIFSMPMLIFKTALFVLMFICWIHSWYLIKRLNQ